MTHWNWNTKYETHVCKSNAIAAGYNWADYWEQGTQAAAASFGAAGTS